MIHASSSMWQHGSFWRYTIPCDDTYYTYMLSWVCTKLHDSFKGDHGSISSKPCITYEDYEHTACAHMHAHTQDSGGPMWGAGCPSKGETESLTIKTDSPNVKRSLWSVPSGDASWVQEGHKHSCHSEEWHEVYRCIVCREQSPQL